MPDSSWIVEFRVNNYDPNEENLTEENRRYTQIRKPRRRPSVAAAIR